MPQITVTVDTNAWTYVFTTSDPSVTPGAETLPVPYEGNFTIVAGSNVTGIDVLSTLPSTATQTTPYVPAMAPVTDKATSYKLTALGQVTMSVPTYGGHALSGTPLVIAPETNVHLVEGGSSSPPVSFGALVRLVIDGLTKTVDATAPAGLFVGQSGSTVSIAPGGSVYTVDDVYEGSYDVQYDEGTSSKLVTPLVGTINVSSTKRPKGGGA